MVSFAQDIRPLFRDKDVHSMARAFDLSSYDEVRARADAIHGQLEAGTMPCDGTWPADKIALFKQWMDEGYTS